MLQFEQSVYQRMLEDGIRAFPDECCGFLLGSEDKEGNRTITHLIVVDNAKEGDKRRRFVIAPGDYLKAELFAEEKELILLGIYHSHPDHPAIPSETDRLAAQPFFSYVIMSVIDGEPATVTSWLLNEKDQFEEEQISKNQIINQQ
jgi:proteasome lid subunit RPN8/RPN11